MNIADTAKKPVVLLQVQEFRVLILGDSLIIERGFNDSLGVHCYKPEMSFDREVDQVKQRPLVETIFHLAEKSGIL